MKKCKNFFVPGFCRIFKSYEIYLSVIGVAIALVFSIEQMNLINGNVLDTYITSTELSGIMVAYIFCAFPFATVFCEDLENKYIRYSIIRGNLKKYVFSQISIIYLTSIAVMVLGTAIFLMGCRTTGPWTNESTGTLNMLLHGNYGSLLKTEHYFMYCISYSLQMGLLSGLLSALAAYFSLYISNRVTVLVLPLVIHQILLETAGESMYTVLIFRAYNKPLEGDLQSFLLVCMISFVPTVVLGIMTYKKIQKRL